MNKRDKFRDREYRASYADSFLDTFIATQIRVIREQRGLTQVELADIAGMRQSRISALEDANYSRWSIGTLKRLARAFDVPLSVSFGTFGDLLADVNTFRRRGLERAEFIDDPIFAATTGIVDQIVTLTNASLIQTGTTVARVLPFQRHSMPLSALGRSTTTETIIAEAAAS